MHMHRCIDAYMHTCIDAYMHTCTHAYMHAYMHAYIHAYMRIDFTHIDYYRPPALDSICVHDLGKSLHTSTRMHTCMHAYIHVDFQIHMHFQYKRSCLVMVWIHSYTFPIHILAFHMYLETYMCACMHACIHACACV